MSDQQTFTNQSSDMLVATILQAIKDSEQKIVNAIKEISSHGEVEEVTESGKESGKEDPQEFKIFSLDELPTMPTPVIGKEKFEVSVVANMKSGKVVMKFAYDHTTSVADLKLDVHDFTTVDLEAFNLMYFNKKMDAYRRLYEYLSGSENKQVFMAVVFRGGGVLTSFNVFSCCFVLWLSFVLMLLTNK